MEGQRSAQPRCSEEGLLVARYSGLQCGNTFLGRVCDGSRRRELVRDNPDGLELGFGFSNAFAPDSQSHGRSWLPALGAPAST